MVNPTVTDKEYLMQDFASIITSFCARLYSRRRAKRKIEAIIETLNKEKDNETSGTSLD